MIRTKRPGRENGPEDETTENETAEDETAPRTKRRVPHNIYCSNGSIILLSSVSGYTPFVDLGLYSATQTGVLGLCKVLAQSLARKKIRVNSVCLGMCDDDNSGASWSTTCGYSSEEDVKRAQMTRQHLSSFIPLGRTGRAGDCTGLIEFLASDQASYITGENICVNGGVSVKL